MCVRVVVWRSGRVVTVLVASTRLLTSSPVARYMPSGCVKLAFHDTDRDTDTDTDTDFFVDILARIVARMSVSVSVLVSASWNFSLTNHRRWTVATKMDASLVL